MIPTYPSNTNTTEEDFLLHRILGEGWDCPEHGIWKDTNEAPANDDEELGFRCVLSNRTRRRDGRRYL